MRILIIGAGGREHALCWKLAQSPERPKLFAAPGNPGVATLAECTATTDYIALAESIQPDFTIVGPEVPLAAGIADRFRNRGWRIVGPSAAAARIESSKAFSKTVMEEAGVPTARHITVTSREDALTALKQFPLPVVLKADGLAAGKGVIIAQTEADARQAIPRLLAVSPQLVIEEYLTGEEVSFIVLTDGTNVIPLEPAQDHKAVSDGDQGPNTGGMGAYCDGRILSGNEQIHIVDTLIRPVLSVMLGSKCHFNGFLYAGLMMTTDGPKVLEFNCRLGDPETQVLMHRLSSDFIPCLLATANGTLPERTLNWRTEPSVCVVLAGAGYPEAPRVGDIITGLDDVTDGVAFHAGTKLNGDTVITSGGRVLGITARGPSLQEAIANTYADVQKVSFPGMHYRSDIGRSNLPVPTTRY
ncbi:MAG: phosphoribosylamine--glycine ligase [Nitrospirota bacterium]